MLAENAKPITQAVLSRDGTPIACERRGQGHPLILVDGALCSRTMCTAAETLGADIVGGPQVPVFADAVHGTEAVCPMPRGPSQAPPGGTGEGDA